jgi:zinc transport system ATP-binding protein
VLIEAVVTKKMMAPSTTVEKDRILQVSKLGVKLRNQVVLEDVSFKLRKGETLAIVGPNGAGKTVLFRALLNLMPHTGKIEWADKVKIGYVPQTMYVSDIPISIKEFLMFKSSVNMEEALESVGLDKEILNKPLDVLSGGQLQRVLIAWAIIDNPNVLLFDEPTADVDMGSVEAIYKMLDELRKRREITILLISHDVHIVRDYSDYMLALNKCVTFFGKSKKIGDLSVQRMIFGEPVCLAYTER